MKKIFTVLAFTLLLAPSLVQAQVRIGAGRSSGTNDIDVDYSNPHEYIIADITVSGAKFLDPNSLISLSGLKKGDKIRIPGESISGAIKRLWDQGLVGGVDITATKVEGENIYLDIFVRERPRLSKFTFGGLRKGEVDALHDKIKLIRGRIVTDALVKNTQLQVKKHFVEKGFLNTTVTINQIADTVLSNSIVMKINVDKKTKVKINSLTFTGREALPERMLRKKMKGTKQKKFLRIFTPSKFIPSKYEEDKKKLIAYYNSEGYRDATIVSDTVYKHSDKTINVDLTIEEGKKYYFRDITWTGNYVYTSQFLSEVLGLKKGDVYNMEELEKRLNYSPTTQDITSLYMDNGYLFFNIEPVEVAVDGDSIDVEMRIYEGAQANINKVIVNGNTQTNDHVVLREIRTLPGQKFSRAALIRTQREIATLGYFDPEKIGINPVPNPQDGTVDIEYTVEEKPSDQIELSGGWGGYYGFVGTLGLVFNNFSARKIFDFKSYHPVPKGDGQRLALRFQASGKQYQTYSATFSEPWLGGRKPNSFSISLSHTVQNLYGSSTYNPYAGYGYGNYGGGLGGLGGYGYGYGTTGAKTGSFQVTGFTLSLGKRLKKPDDYFTLSNSLSYQLYQLQNYPGFIPGLQTGYSNSIVFNTTIARNSIDNPTFPRNGSSISLSVSLTPPYSLLDKSRNPSTESVSQRYKFIEYHKWMFDATWYTNLVGKLVLATRAHMGFLGRYNSQMAFSPFERFVMGGSGLSGQGFYLARDIIGLRGYQDNSITPTSPDGTYGGIVYDKFVMELRYPISLNPSATIFVLGFAEGGNNWGNYQDYNPLNIKRSVGGGARIFMPAFGLIGIDYGWGFDRPGGPGGQFHFTIGQQIR